METGFFQSCRFCGAYALDPKTQHKRCLNCERVQKEIGSEEDFFDFCHDKKNRRFYQKTLQRMSFLLSSPPSFLVNYELRFLYLELKQDKSEEGRKVFKKINDRFLDQLFEVPEFEKSFQLITEPAPEDRTVNNLYWRAFLRPIGLTLCIFVAVTTVFFLQS